MLEKLGLVVAQIDTDGMWVFVPDNFPLIVKCKSGYQFELLRELINSLCDRKFNNPKYGEFVGGKWN